jgi:hypothetical protein
LQRHLIRRILDSRLMGSFCCLFFLCMCLQPRLESVMSTLRHWLCLLVSSSLLLGTAAYAATAQPPAAQAMMDALTKATTAVVGVKVTAMDGRTLGGNAGPEPRRLGRADRPRTA